MFAVLNELWQEHFSVACCSLPAFFFPDRGSSASSPHLAVARHVMHSWPKFPVSSGVVERRKVYTQNVVKYNWGKMLQDKRLLLRCTLRNFETPLPTARLRLCLV